MTIMTMSMTSLTHSLPAVDPPSYTQAVMETTDIETKADDVDGEKTRTDKHSPPSYASTSSSASSSSSSSSKCIVIPQTTTRVMNAILYPFARAYPPCLADKGIDEQRFLRFIDGLNEAFMMLPVFRVLRSLGQATAFAPTGITYASGVAGAAMSERRTRAYLEKHNAETFAPIGLQVRVLTTIQLLSILNNGKDAERQMTRLALAPLPDSFASVDTNPCVRRMTALGNSVASLRWDVEVAQKPDQWFKKVGAWHARRPEAKAERRLARRCEVARRAASEGNDHKVARQKRRIEKNENKVTQKIRWIVFVPTSANSVAQGDGMDEWCEELL